MRKLFLGAILLFALFFSTYSQNRDMQNSLISQPSDDTNKVNLLLNMGRSYVYSNSDSCFYFANEGLQLAQTLHDLRGESLCLSLIGLSFSKSGRDLTNGLDYALRSLYLAEQLNDPEVSLYALNSLGGVYYTQGDYRKALEYYFETLSLSQRIGNDNRIIVAWENLEYTYMALNILDSTQYFANLSYQKSETIHDTVGMARDLNILGEIYKRRKSYPKAMEFCKNALVFEKAKGLMDQYTSSTLSIAEIFRQQNRLDSALFYGQLSLTVASNNKFGGSEVDATDFLEGFY